jgi:hypothetical protein
VLKLEPLRPAAGGGLDLTVTAANGTPLTMERFSGIAVMATTNLGVPVAQWTKLTNVLVLTNGSGRVALQDTKIAGCRFFSVVETAPQR